MPCTTCDLISGADELCVLATELDTRERKFFLELWPETKEIKDHRDPTGQTLYHHYWNRYAEDYGGNGLHFIYNLSDANKYVVLAGLGAKKMDEVMKSIPFLVWYYNNTPISTLPSVIFTKSGGSVSCPCQLVYWELGMSKERKEELAIFYLYETKKAQREQSTKRV